VKRLKNSNRLQSQSDVEDEFDLGTSPDAFSSCNKRFKVWEDNLFKIWKCFCNNENINRHLTWIGEVEKESYTFLSIAAKLRKSH